MFECLKYCSCVSSASFKILKPLSPFALWGIIKLGGPGFAKPDRHLVMILSDTYMFSSWIAMMVSGGQNPVLWLVDFLEGESVCVSVCVSVCL